VTVYLAGAADCVTELRGRPMLESFWYRNNAEKAMAGAGNFFLDSGAFTAFTQGEIIDIKELARFIVANQTRIAVASSLDAIGDAEQSYRNYRIMKDELGLDVIPVFHCREDLKWLLRYLREGAPYLALGGMVPETIDYKSRWLDDLFSKHLTDAEHHPIVKVHGFGLTVGWLIERYPWFSVDSTTWRNGMKFGVLIVNFEGSRLRHIGFTATHPQVRDKTSTHIDRLSKLERRVVMEQLEQYGITLEALRERPRNAMLFNAWSFQEWERLYGFPKTFTAAQQQEELW
jgi:hypothetical protein